MYAPVLVRTSMSIHAFAYGGMHDKAHTSTYVLVQVRTHNVCVHALVQVNISIHNMHTSDYIA